MQKQDSLLEQLAEEDKTEQEQKREKNSTGAELISEATKKMAAVAELQNMQSVKVAQMMLKAGNEKVTGNVTESQHHQH